MNKGISTFRSLFEESAGIRTVFVKQKITRQKSSLENSNIGTVIFKKVYYNQRIIMDFFPYSLKI